MRIDMTIDEVIEHCKRTVEFESKYIMIGKRGGEKAEYSKRYLEHKLVAEWLEDYKKLKSIDEDLRLKYCYEDLSDADNWGYLRGYNEAIDDFVKNIKKCSGWTPNCIESWHDVCLTIYTLYQIAEELKKECAE